MCIYSTPDEKYVRMMILLIIITIAAAINYCKFYIRAKSSIDVCSGSVGEVSSLTVRQRFLAHSKHLVGIGLQSTSQLQRQDDGSVEEQTYKT